MSVHEVWNSTTLSMFRNSVWLCLNTSKFRASKFPPHPSSARWLRIFLSYCNKRAYQGSSAQGWNFLFEIFFSLESWTETVSKRNVLTDELKNNFDAFSTIHLSQNDTFPQPPQKYDILHKSQPGEESIMYEKCCSLELSFVPPGPFFLGTN